MKDKLTKVEGTSVRPPMKNEETDDGRHMPMTDGHGLSRGRGENVFLQNEANLEMQGSPGFIRVKWWFLGLKNKANKPNLKPKKANLNPIKAIFGRGKAMAKPFFICRVNSGWRRVRLRLRRRRVGGTPTLTLETRVLQRVAPSQSQSNHFMITELIQTRTMDGSLTAGRSFFSLRNQSSEPQPP